VSTDRVLKLRVEIHHKKLPKMRKKNFFKTKLQSAARKVVFIKRMFAKRDDRNLMRAFEAEWNREELQMYLKKCGYDEEELSDLKEVMKENYFHTSISFKAVCANVGESRWMTSAGFRALIKKSRICQKAKLISEIWTTLNQGDVGNTIQTTVRGVIKSDSNNMDRAEFLEALVRLSETRKTEGVSIATAYKEMYELYKRNAIGEEVVEIERYLSNSEVNALFLKYEKPLSRCFQNFAGVQGHASSIDIGEFMLFFEKLLGERVPKSCHLSRREILGIFFQSQIVDETKDAAGEDEYELDKIEFNEAIVRTVHVVMKKIAQLPEKEKEKKITFEIPDNFIEQLSLMLGWIKILSKLKLK